MVEHTPARFPRTRLALPRWGSQSEPLKSAARRILVSREARVGPSCSRAQCPWSCQKRGIRLFASHTCLHAFAAAPGRQQDFGAFGFIDTCKRPLAGTKNSQSVGSVYSKTTCAARLTASSPKRRRALSRSQKDVLHWTLKHILHKNCFAYIIFYTKRLRKKNIVREQCTQMGPNKIIIT